MRRNRSSERDLYLRSDLRDRQEGGEFYGRFLTPLTSLLTFVLVLPLVLRRRDLLGSHECTVQSRCRIKSSLAFSKPTPKEKDETRNLIQGARSIEDAKTKCYRLFKEKQGKCEKREADWYE